MRKNLKEARQKAGMTQKQVADQIGVTLSHYQMIEKGDRTGAVDLWDKLEDLFNNACFVRFYKIITTK